MNYRLLPEHSEIRSRFIDTFVASYSEFAVTHKDWICELREKHGIEFDEKYYSEMYMWDRITKNDRVISFADALNLLRNKNEEVLFLTEDPKCRIYDFCELNKETYFVAVSLAQELAECISYEWFTSYELIAQYCYLADKILPEDLYVFDRSFTWCLVFTHETTDENQTAESRLCIFIDNNS